MPYEESTIPSSNRFSMLNSLAMVDNAGATIDDETGDMKVKDETTSVANHFRFVVQFFGLAGSSGPSQVT